MAKPGTPAPAQRQLAEQEPVAIWLRIDAAIREVARLQRKMPAEIKAHLEALAPSGMLLMRVSDGDYHRELRAQELTQCELDLAGGTGRVPVIRLMKEEGGDDALRGVWRLSGPRTLEVNVANLAYWCTIRRRDESRRKSRSGRPREFNWDLMAVELLRWVYWYGDPQPQSAVEWHLAEWFENTFGKQPDERELRRRVAVALERMRQPIESDTFGPQELPPDSPRRFRGATR